MFIRIPVIAFVMSVSLAFAQLDSNSVTVTASRSVNLQADQVTFNVVVNTGLSASLNDALAALQGTGITASNLYYVDVSPPNSDTTNTTTTGTTMAGAGPGLNWVFSLAAPLTKLKDTITVLTNQQQVIAHKNNGLSLSFYVLGTQASPAVRQTQGCNLGDVIADARVQAQKLAEAAGLSVGTVLALSSSTAVMLYPGTCSATVKFALR